jgi:hypothetical protein
VVDRFVGLGTVFRETDVEWSDLETTIVDLMFGQFNDPIRVVAFNTAEGWALDVSKDIAFEIQSRCDIDGQDVPETLRDFVDTHAGPDRQLTLRLAWAMPNARPKPSAAEITKRKSASTSDRTPYENKPAGYRGLVVGYRVMYCGISGACRLWHGQNDMDGQADHRVPGKMTRSYFVALAFIRDVDDTVPGDAVECSNAMDAALQAQVLSHAAANIGAVAYSRTENDLGIFGEAVIIKKFGDVPSDLRMLF